MIMHVAIRICKTVADVLQPLLPFTAHKYINSLMHFQVR